MPEFEVRPVRPEDAREMAELLAAVVEERDGIATEPPVDVDARTHEFVESAAGSLVAEADGAIVGMIRVGAAASGSASSQMLVEREWRGRGVGSALVAAAIEEARSKGLHKLSLDVYAHVMPLDEVPEAHLRDWLAV